MYSIYIYKSLLVNVSVSLIVSEVPPHMTLVDVEFRVALNTGSQWSVSRENGRIKRVD